jgi:hypothetical protein
MTITIELPNLAVKHILTSIVGTVSAPWSRTARDIDGFVAANVPGSCTGSVRVRTNSRIG